MEQLADDMLADVLGRLPPSSLAASRCVRKHWCSIIDGRRLLRADLLPLRLDAFYCISLDCIERLTYLFARPPAAARRIPGGPLDFLEHYSSLEVGDHCNGLLLVCDCMVINPATRQWAELPSSPEPSIGDMLGGVSVWAGTTADQENDDHSFLFRMVRSPATRSKLGAESATFYLGKSEKGVYFALLYWVSNTERTCWCCPQFRVWLLKEEEEMNDGNHCSIHMEWVLKTTISLEPLLAKPPPPLHSRHSFADDEWSVIRNYNEELEAPPAAAAAAAQDHDDEFAADDEWDFDNADEVVHEANKDNKAEADGHYPVDFLGFHPYKEIVFFSLSSRTISYNLNTSKVQHSWAAASTYRWA
ncbi:uncharacterized protein LOC101767909 [Setaria italica]|uniref:uncharacterized protein LOC101767909 n=1 Tax=Setaria italica TaxID=4555 RepID=UPI0006490C9C|nr:uncharacterized protein LOC101767909 [Setaria italica]